MPTPPPVKKLRAGHLVVGILLLAAALGAAFIPGLGPAVTTALLGQGIEEVQTGLEPGSIPETMTPVAETPPTVEPPPEETPVPAPFPLPVPSTEETPAPALEPALHPGEVVPQP